MKNLLDIVNKTKIYKIANIGVTEKFIKFLEKFYVEYEKFQLYLKDEKVKTLHKTMEEAEKFNLRDYFPYLGQGWHYGKIIKKLEEKGIELERNIISTYCFKDFKHTAYSLYHTFSALGFIISPFIALLIKNR